MHREGIKSLILTVLVVISALLTINMWNYQPEFSRTDTKKAVQATSIHEKVDDAVLLCPSVIVVHKDKGIFESTNETILAKTFKQIRGWELSNFEYGASGRDNQTLADWIGKIENIELVFSGQVPLTDFRILLENDKQNLPEILFDRIVIQKDASKGRVRFISTKQQKIVSATISSKEVTDLQGEFKQLGKEFYKVDRLTSKDNGPIIYARSNSTTLADLHYYVDFLDIEDYKKVLFTDVDSVKKVTKEKIETMTDGSSLMNNYLDTSTFSFVKPKIGLSSVENQLDYVHRGIDFVNSHAGWDSRYRFENFDAETGESRFRLQIDGVPAFNANGMAELTLTMGIDGVRAYAAPYFSLDLLVKDEKRTTRKLPSGAEVLEGLKKQKGFELSRLDNLKIGYKLSFSHQARYLVKLEPSWFYQYDQNWAEVQLTSQEVQHGLE